jgi:hypothetical protein
MVLWTTFNVSFKLNLKCIGKLQFIYGTMFLIACPIASHIKVYMNCHYVSSTSEQKMHSTHTDSNDTPPSKLLNLYPHTFHVYCTFHGGLLLLLLFQNKQKQMTMINKTNMCITLIDCSSLYICIIFTQPCYYNHGYTLEEKGANINIKSVTCHRQITQFMLSLALTLDVNNV